MADDVIRDDSIEYEDYFYPLLGIVFSIRKDRVHIMYQIKRYGYNGPDELLDVDINCDSEEKADQIASEMGEIKDKMHLHQRLQRDQEVVLAELAKNGESNIDPGVEI